jgi:hypothetical protein
VKIITVQLLLDVENEAQACDAANEILREQQRSWAPQSCLIDYAVGSNVAHSDRDPKTYEEGDEPFTLPLWP